MSSASSNQSVVHDGVDYEEVYPSSHKDQESPGEDRSPSASSSSSTSEDVEEVEQEEASNDDEGHIVRSVIGADGLREFVMLPEWTVNNFTSTIKENHFKIFRDNYQISNSIPIRLPYKSEKCYYDRVQGVGVYEQMLKVGLRFISVHLVASGSLISNSHPLGTIRPLCGLCFIFIHVGLQIIIFL